MPSIRPWLSSLLPALALLLSWAAAPAHAGDPPTTPFLRIETGLHTAAINRLATDRAGRIVATASDDKTVRLWHVSDGSRIGVLRVPSDLGGVGALYAVTLSPDGRSLLAGGYTGLWDGAPVLYLFDAEKQTLRGRLSVPGVVNHLAYSPDGRYFAGAFGGTAGIRVWEAQSGRLVAEDHNYRDRTTGLAFDGAGRLASASFDGTIRLYDATFRLVAQQKTLSGKQPYSLAFSPDDGLLAVGFADQPRVDLLSGQDLSRRPSPQSADLRSGNLAAVAWTVGPEPQLLAGGTAARTDGWMIVRRWGQQGRGQPLDIPAARDSITQLLALPDGGALVAAADPAWGRISPEGKLALYQGGGIADFRDIANGRFAIAADGLALEFGLAKGGRQPYRFDLRSRRYQPAESADPTFDRPQTESRTLAVSGWKNGTTPRLGALPLKLDSAERSLSLALAPEGRRFLLGTDFNLRLYDAKGVELRRVAVPGAAWGVVIARNGTVAAAALGDGTVRWYSLLPGEELEERAALYADPDGRRWVAWTPEGFFDHADLGGKDLVGFALNQGKNKAPLWVDFAQIYRLFYAPELVLARLTGTGRSEVINRLASIGDVRARLDQRPLPGIELAEYCPVSEPAEPGSRGVGRAEPVPAAAAAPASAAVPAIPPPAPAPLAPAASPAADNCLPIDLTQAVRAQGRSLTAVAAPDGASAATPGAPGTAAAGEPIAFAAELPPGARAVRLRFRVSDQGGGVGAVDLFLNDRNAGRDSTSRGLARTDAAASPAAIPSPAPAGAPAQGVPPTTPAAAPAPLLERLVVLDPGSNRIAIRAFEGSNGVFARSPVIELVAAAPKTTPTAEPPKPRLLVLAVGINRYQGRGIPPLRFAVADAQTFAANVRRYATPIYGEPVVTELYDEQASTSGIETALTRLAAEARSDDTVLLYLAGHGISDAPNYQIDRYYFVPQSVTSVASLTREALSENRLIELISQIRARNSFLFLDTCHAGALTNNDAAKLGNEAGRFVLAASASVQEALDSFDGHNGIMAVAITRGLAGEAGADRKGFVNNLNLGIYVQEEVKALAQSKSWDQKAVFKISADGAQPFPLAKVGP